MSVTPSNNTICQKGIDDDDHPRTLVCINCEHVEIRTILKRDENHKHRKKTTDVLVLNPVKSHMKNDIFEMIYC